METKIISGSQANSVNPLKVPGVNAPQSLSVTLAGRFPLVLHLELLKHFYDFQIVLPNIAAGFN